MTTVNWPANLRGTGEYALTFDAELQATLSKSLSADRLDRPVVTIDFRTGVITWLDQDGRPR